MGGGGQTNGQGGEITTPMTHHYVDKLNGEIIYNTALKELLTDETDKWSGWRNNYSNDSPLCR